MNVHLGKVRRITLRQKITQYQMMLLGIYFQPTHQRVNATILEETWVQTQPFLPVQLWYGISGEIRVVNKQVRTSLFQCKVCPCLCLTKHIRTSLLIH